MSNNLGGIGKAYSQFTKDLKSTDVDYKVFIKNSVKSISKKLKISYGVPVVKSKTHSFFRCDENLNERNREIYNEYLIALKT